jgi:hypothetical protein
MGDSQPEKVIDADVVAARWRRGDTPSAIGRRCGVSAWDIKRFIEARRALGDQRFAPRPDPYGGRR